LLEDGVPMMAGRCARLVAVALSLGLAACQNTSDAVAHVDATWTLLLAGSGDMTTTCPSGDDTAALHSQPVDISGNPMGQPFVQLLACGSGAGSSTALPPGAYNEWVTIQDRAGTMPAAQSPTTLDLNGSPLTLDVSNVSIDEMIILDGGLFKYEWNLVGATSGSAVMCAVAGATTLSMTATNVQNTASTFTSTTPCSNDTGIVHLVLSNPIPTGLYSVGISAVTAAGSAVGPATTLTNAMIQAPTALMPVTDLGQVMVQVNGL
jgi:hypothetical protein